MKLKEIDRNGNITWSPKSIDRSYLVVGTASHQLDSNFSSESSLEIFEYVPNEKGFDMPVMCSLKSETKFSKLLWGNVCDNYGLIIGGSDNGALSIYDCKQLLINNVFGSEQLSEVLVKREHKGPVHSMDFNKFKANLLATGGSESDIFIWDLDKYDEPMTPGNKSQPFEEICSLSWNHKVQHILGSTSTHRCQIWDLRKSDPVIKLSDTQMKMKSGKLVWHPEISTRLCIASEDDHTPIIQLWDLRYIQCPFHTLQRHTKGIVDLQWCSDDPDILMSVARDRQLICWNMSAHNSSSNINTTSEVIYEWQLDQDMINEAQFCPKHPGLVSVSSYDCHISLYSLLGGRGHVPRELSETVIDSFPLDLYEEDNNEIERIKKEAEKAAELQLIPTPCLLKAPKWLKRPCGASFSFDGRLVQFYKTESSRSRNNSVSQTGSLSINDNTYKIFISKICTHKELAKASAALDITVHETDNKKIKSDYQFDYDIWKFIECHFLDDSRSAFIQNLGYGDFGNRKYVEENKGGECLPNKDHTMLFNNYNNVSNNFGVNNDLSTEFSIANLQLIPSYDGIERSLATALMTGDIDYAIDICLQQNRTGEAAILAVSSGRQDLFEKVQNKIFDTNNQTSTTYLIGIAVKRNWKELVQSCDLRYWKEVLVWLLTYASTEELAELCEMLGVRLEEQGTFDNNDYFFILSACLCYICSGSINNVVRCWLKCNSTKSTTDLQRLVEIIVLLCKSVGDDDFSTIAENTAEIYTRYAMILTSQGELATALKYLGSNNEKNITMLRHRICERLANKLPSGVSAPKIPFKVTAIFPSISTNLFKTPSMGSSQHFTDNLKLTNQVSNCYKSSSNYPVIQNQLGNSAINNPVQKIFSNEAQMNFNLNQITNNPVVNPLPPVSNNVSQNYFRSSQPSQPSPIKLPFVPDNARNLMSTGRLQPPSPSHPPVMPAGNIQKHHNPILNKSAWNDPPLLSENYRAETTKEELKVQQSFFTPISTVNDLSDIANFSTKAANANIFPPTNASNAFNSLPHFMNSTTEYYLPNQNQISAVNHPSVELSKEVEKSDEKLSPEYEHIQTVLMNLIEKCRQKDKSRQIKVKMDDIEKKIVNLFDILKTQSMSTELAYGFSSLISTLEANNYRQSYDEINNIIQNVNFSEAGLYLPSVKMLIQCAIKCFSNE